MRIGVIAALSVVSVPATADSGRVEATGFVGVDYFGDDIGLGGSPAPEQRPQTAPTFGGRLTYIPLRLGSGTSLDIGVEAEASFTPSWTGYGFDGPRASYFAPVLGYRANVLLRLGGNWLQPFVIAGGGGESVISDSPFMAKETDPVFQWGGGVQFVISERYLLRFDGRQGIMESIDGGTTRTYEANLSVGARLGVAAKKHTPVTRVEIVQRPLPPAPVDKDSDSDGILDSRDKCPARPESANGIEDQDGCPEPDSDGDGLVDVVDKCPDRAEDKDQFEDEDGCADDDNDRDGIPDLRDKCPLEAEIKNNITDDDGCADEIPAEITNALGAAKTVKFEKNRAPLTPAAKASLDMALVVTLNYPRLKLTLTVHPESAEPKAIELATKRLQVVKFYLTEQGVSIGNLTTTVGAPVADKKAPLVELSVTP